MKAGIITCLFFIVFSDGIAQDSLSKTDNIMPEFKFKLSLLDQSVFSLPVLKASSEILLSRDANFPTYASVEAGYNYYSNDENVRCRGYFLGARYHQYIGNRSHFKHGLSFGAFYLKSFLNDYLKVTKTMPGMGTYYEYERMKYYKERYAFTVEYFIQAGLGRKFFVEMCVGGGLMKMQTITPSRVTQETFVNGMYFRPDVLTIAPFASVKLGYNLFRK